MTTLMYDDTDVPYSKKFWRGKTLVNLANCHNSPSFFTKFVLHVQQHTVCFNWFYVLKMSILQYFKKQEKTSSPSGDNLPDPTGPLSEKIPLKAIVTVNQKVMEVLEKQGGSP